MEFPLNVKHLLYALIVAVVMGSCGIIAAIAPTFVIYFTAKGDQTTITSGENDVVIVTATPDPSALYPTYEPITSVTDSQEGSSEPLNWVQAETPYGNAMSWSGPITITGPAVVEWWDKQDPGFTHEGYFFLKSGETANLPSGHIGTWWQIAAGDEAVQALETSFRHLLFYKDKAVHSYMDTWLTENGYGSCNFDEQTGCAALDSQINHRP